MSTIFYEYKGFRYSQSIDEEPNECIKIFHDVESPAGRRFHLDWSPYSTPTENDFRLWVDLGCPDRMTFGIANHEARVYCPINREDLEKLLPPPPPAPGLPEMPVTVYYERIACRNTLLIGEPREKAAPRKAELLVNCPTKEEAKELLSELELTQDFAAYSFDRIDDAVYIEGGLTRLQLVAPKMYALGWINGRAKK